MVIISLIIHITLGIIAILGLKKKSIISFGILYYAITFSIVSNILFPIGTFMSERFMYMPSIGWAIIVAFLIMKLSQLIKKEKYQSLSTALIIILITPFSLLTINRNTAWENDYILFTSDVKT